MNQLKRVLIVGGTHGNELIGIYLIRKFERSHHLISRPSFETVTLLANPKAYEMRSRYVDSDLNRCFRQEDLADSCLLGYEARRAKEIYQTFGSNGRQPTDFVIDLHTTTANMGLTLILASKHPFNLQLASHLTKINRSVKVLYSLTEGQNNCYLHSISECGCTIEVGPVAQNVLDAALFQTTESVVASILDYLEIYNQGTFSQFEEALTFYQLIERVDYPRNNRGEIQAMIHPRLQGKDYEPIDSGDPLFLTFDEQTIVYEGSSTVYPVFINEAAYYEKGVAMCLTEKRQVKLETS